VRQSFKFTFFKAKRLKHLHRTIDLSAQIWNHCVALHRRYYKLFGKGLCEGKLKAHLAKLRNGRFSHWKAVGSQSVQAIVERLYLAWAAFFKDIRQERRKTRNYGSPSPDLSIIGQFKNALFERIGNCAL
jgi:putative transposase